MSLGIDLEEAYSVGRQYNSSFLQDNEVHNIFDDGHFIPDERHNGRHNNTVVDTIHTPFVETVNTFPMQQSDAQPHLIQPQVSQSVENVNHPPTLVPYADHQMKPTNPVQQHTPSTAFHFNYDSVRDQLQKDAQNQKLSEMQHAMDIKQRPMKISEHFSDKEKDKDKENGERYMSKRRSDLFKSILFTFMILLAISTHSFITFVYEQFFTANGTYSLKQETGLRLIYPIAILGFIWYAKS